MKKFITLMMALVLCFTLAVTAAAADVETRTFHYAGNDESYCTLEGIFTPDTTFSYVDYKGKEYSRTGITAVLDPDSPVVTNGFNLDYLNWDGTKYVKNRYSGSVFSSTTAKELFIYNGEPVDVVLVWGTESWVFLKLSDSAQAPGNAGKPASGIVAEDGKFTCTTTGGWVVSGEGTMEENYTLNTTIQAESWPIPGTAIFLTPGSSFSVTDPSGNAVTALNSSTYHDRIPESSDYYIRERNTPDLVAGPIENSFPGSGVHHLIIADEQNVFLIYSEPVDPRYTNYVVESGYSMTYFYSAYADRAVPVYAQGRSYEYLIPLNIKSGSKFGFGGMEGFCAPIPFYKATYNASTGTISGMKQIPLDFQTDSYGYTPEMNMDELVRAAEGVEGNAIVFSGYSNRMDELNSDIYGALFLVQVDGQKPVAPAPMSFPDLTKTDTFYEDIEWMYSVGLMNGMSDGNFNRKGNVSRQQVWRILSRAIEGQDVGSMANAKTWAIEYGVSDGTRPGDAATREEFITMMWKAFGSMEADTGVLSRFTDAASISEESRTAMAWAVEVGITEGYSDGTLRPAATATRGAFAAIMHRYLGK